jgi:hypothetical protein
MASLWHDEEEEDAGELEALRESLTVVGKRDTLAGYTLEEVPQVAGMHPRATPLTWMVGWLGKQALQEVHLTLTQTFTEGTRPQRTCARCSSTGTRCRWRSANSSSCNWSGSWKRTPTLSVRRYTRTWVARAWSR